MSTSSRKLDHIRICLDQKVDTGDRPLEDIVLLHKALPGRVAASAATLGNTNRRQPPNPERVPSGGGADRLARAERQRPDRHNPFGVGSFAVR